MSCCCFVLFVVAGRERIELSLADIHIRHKLYTRWCVEVDECLIAKNFIDGVISMQMGSKDIAVDCFVVAEGLKCSVCVTMEDIQSAMKAAIRSCCPVCLSRCLLECL